MSIRLLLAAVVAMMVTSGCGSASAPSTITPPAATMADVGGVPAAPAALQAGEALYSANCLSCHGAGGQGTEQGPPFMHPFYLPGHHGDNAFVNAALNGVTAHHWQFGDMLPIPGVTEADVRQIVAYVRWLQENTAMPPN